MFPVRCNQECGTGPSSLLCKVGESFVVNVEPSTFRTDKILVFKPYTRLPDVTSVSPVRLVISPMPRIIGPGYIERVEENLTALADQAEGMPQQLVETREILNHADTMAQQEERVVGSPFKFQHISLTGIPDTPPPHDLHSLGIDVDRRYRQAGLLKNEAVKSTTGADVENGTCAMPERQLFKGGELVRCPEEYVHWEGSNEPVIASDQDF